MAKKVSIIVCTYNARGDLKECLESLENQDYKHIEIIVVNDASTDDTLEFLQQFQDRTKTETVVITNKTNLGVAGSRNVGIRCATGEIIAFLDADSTADKRWIAELVKCFEQEDVAAVGGKILDARVSNIWELSIKGHNFIASKEGYVTHIRGGNMAFDSKVLKKFMFNEEIKYGYEEILICDYLIENGYKIYYNPRAIVHHKNRSNLRTLLRQKYLLGLSSIWYRKKQNKFLMLKRHFLLLIAFLLVPFFAMDKFFLYFSLGLFSVSSLSLLRDEFLFDEKSIKEMAVTFPFLVLIEFSHLWGAIVGIVKFRFFENVPLK